VTTYPNPTSSQIKAAFDKHKVRYKVEPLRAGSAGRAWSSGLRASVDHHTAGTNSLGYLLNSGGTYPMVQTLIDKDGLVHVLTWLSCWGSGDGGPWNGVASKDSLHLVGWQNEVESKGTSKDFTAAQLESLGRVNAALVSLGMPAANEINHRDWTDGTGGVGGYPLPTKGRKIDTLYETTFLRDNTKNYKISTTPPPDPIPVPDQNLEGLPDMAFMVRSVDKNKAYLVEAGKIVEVSAAMANNFLAPINDTTVGVPPLQYFQAGEPGWSAMVKAYGPIISM